MTPDRHIFVADGQFHVREYLRVTPEQLEARAVELDAAGWKVAGAAGFSEGHGIEVLMVRVLEGPPPREAGET